MGSPTAKRRLSFSDQDVLEKNQVNDCNNGISVKAFSRRFCFFATGTSLALVCMVLTILASQNVLGIVSPAACRALLGTGIGVGIGIVATFILCRKEIFLQSSTI